jgi:glycosyltransferase involved in cell wall biosynthesis
MDLAYFHYLSEGSTGLHHVQHLADALRELGHTVSVHAMNRVPADDPPPASRRQRLRSVLKRRWRRYLHEPKELVWNLKYMRRERDILARQRPQVVLARNDTFLASIVRVTAAQRLPLVLEMNAPALESRLYWDEYSHLPLIPERLEAWKLERTDSIVAVSSALARYLIETYDLPVDKVTVARNGVRLDLFRPDAPRRWSPPESFQDAPVVGFVGSFQRFHGADLLCEMARRVAAARPEARFLFIGDGPGLSLARRLTADLKDRVHFPGALEHELIPGAVTLMDVTVLPETAFYTSPLKLTEWMAAGRAIVAPDRESVRELLEDQRDALLFPPGDPEPLAGAVVRLLDSTPLRETLGAAAARRARASLTWHRTAESVIAACERALAARSATSS